MSPKACTRELTKVNLGKLEACWGSKYPVVIGSWRRNRSRLSVHFDCAPEIRRMIYTTNIIESFHLGLRKATKTKEAFASEEALLKLLYLVQEEITSKWKRPVHNWNQTLSQLSILFGDRLRLDL